MRKVFPRPFVTKKKVLTLMVLVVWSLFLWRAINVFKPGVSTATGFNSDCALPILMSNDERPITLFNLYHYGIDRWGGWPFFVGQLVHRSTGYRWTPQSLSMMQTSWLFIGALIFAGLSYKDGPMLATVFLFALCLHDRSHSQIFWLSSFYAWQVTAIVFTWYGLRRLFDTCRKNSSWKFGAWSFFTFVFSYLAIWSSVASLPFLLFLFCLEALRAHLNEDATTRKSNARKLLIIGLAPLLSAALIEQLQKIFYHRYAMAHYGSDFNTRFQLDRGFLLENLVIQANNIMRSFWWPLYLTATLAALFISFALVSKWLKERTRTPEKLKAIFTDDTAVVAIGAYGLSLINFVLTVIVSHVRINSYDDRYLILTKLFGLVSGILTLFLLLKLWALRGERRKYGRELFWLAGVLLLAVFFPVRVPNTEYQWFQQTAVALAQKSPRAILMGDYWGTYVFAALQPDNAMTPVPFERQDNRMPWTRDLVRQAEQVIVQSAGSKLARSAEPPQHLAQYGNSFRLADADWYDNGTFAFARYVKDSALAESIDESAGAYSVVLQRYRNFLKREPTKAEFENWATIINNCQQDAGCILNQRISEDLNLVHSPEFQASGGFIYNLYRVALGRAPSYVEWSRDRNKLLANRSGNLDFVESWISQPEFTSRYSPVLNNREFVNKLFENPDLRRDEQNRTRSLESLNRGTLTRAGLLLDAVNKFPGINENGEAFVTLCYFLYLNRDPDPAGYSDWLQVRRNRPNGEALVIAGFLNSAEYRAKFAQP